MPPAKKKTTRRSTDGTADDEATQKLGSSPSRASKGEEEAEEEEETHVSQVAFEQPPQTEAPVPVAAPPPPIPQPSPPMPEEKEEPVVPHSPPSPPTVPFVCLLCFRPTIMDPVVLHDTINKSPTNPSVCIACSECSIRWYQLQQCISHTEGCSTTTPSANGMCPICNTEEAIPILAPSPSQVVSLAMALPTATTGECVATSSSSASAVVSLSGGRVEGGAASSPFPSLSQWRRDRVLAGGPMPTVAQICNPHTGESTGDKATSALDTRPSVDGRSSCGIVRFDTPSMMDLAPGASKNNNTVGGGGAISGGLDDELSTHPLCGICEEAAGSVDCLVCGFSICDGCQSSVHAKGRYRQHQVVPIGEIAKVAPRRCPCHPSHNLDLYCRKCLVAVCVLCSFSADMHKGHDVVPLEEMAKETAIVVSQATNTLSKLVARSEAAGLWVASQEAIVTDKCQSVVGNVQQYFASLRKVLDEREGQLVEAISTFHNGKVQRLRTARDTFRLLASDGTVVRDCVGALPTTTHPIVTVGLTPAVTHRLQALQGQVAQLSPSHPDLLQLSSDRSVESVVKDIGHLFVPDVAELRCEFPTGSTSVQKAITQLGTLCTPKPPTPPHHQPIIAETTTSPPLSQPKRRRRLSLEREEEEGGASPQTTTIQPRRSSRYAEPNTTHPDDDPFTSREHHHSKPVADGQKRTREPEVEQYPQRTSTTTSAAAPPTDDRYTETVSRRRQYLRFEEEAQPTSPQKRHQQAEQQQHPHSAPPAPAPAPPPRQSLHGIARLFDTSRPSAQRRQPEKKKEGDNSKEGGASSTTGGGGIRLNIS